MEIKVLKTKNPGAKPEKESMGFGKVFTDHMFLMNYNEKEGWHNARIVPFGNLTFSPALMALHYGQTVFEGMKAYKTGEGDVNLFRPEKNMERLNNSCRRLCIPEIDEKFALAAIRTLVDIDKEWVPSGMGESLYIRPFIFATDPVLGINVAEEYIFVVICSPSGPYYKGGLAPVKIHVEDEYVRAVKGGVGNVKTAANYAVSLKAQQEAHVKGFSQVLWLDGRGHEFIEEVGVMNVFFVSGDEVLTPALEGSVLPGITRMSTIEILKDKGYKVQERRISIDELIDAAKSGTLKEAFGTGTAAVISPIGEIGYQGESYKIGKNKVGKITQELYDELVGIQYGRLEDTRNWIVKV